MRPPISEFAPAKINLTLEVLGRRADGYHEIASLVTFARNVGDDVRLRFDPQRPIVVTGPNAGAIGDRNLAEEAFRLFAIAAAPDRPVAMIELEKRLPVAAGVGGGSADAAAMLRLLRRAYPDIAGRIDWLDLARRLGADVPVCFGNEAAIMAGTGEKIAPVALPGLTAAVLVNPNVAVPPDKTARVFQALKAPLLATVPREESIPTFKDPASLLDYVIARKNALETPAISLFAPITDVLAALHATDGCRVARLSGAGPTCFGIYDSSDEAGVAARAIGAARPHWWVRTAELG
ncbi:MAG: 4-(cytidine 5'-diphospho)-2-C-methyl-D-erythritol kinase [Hyphomicrobium sp.]